MPDAEPRFVDTNILVYATQTGSAHSAAALALLGRMEANPAPLWISGQVLREYLAVVTRPQGRLTALPMAAALERVRFFSQRFWIAEDGPDIRSRLHPRLLLVQTRAWMAGLRPP